MHPTIGIIICGSKHSKQFVSEPYIEAIACSGGIPILIPQTTFTGNYPRYRAICDGFLFCGGDDISPRLFGEDLCTEQGHTDMCMDRFHLSFMQYILSTFLPVLGICRGMQVLNIACGGTLWQDIGLQSGSFLIHMQSSSRRSDVSHQVSLSQGSMLCNICGNFIETNSYHHQCIKTIGTGLQITALASDGVVEGLENPSYPFLIGVQWHPECMYHTSSPMKDLFFRFTDCAKTAKTISVPMVFS